MLPQTSSSKNMLRKLGKHLLLLAIPLFILLLMYRNHGHVNKRERQFDINQSRKVSDFPNAQRVSGATLACVTINNC